MKIAVLLTCHNRADKTLLFLRSLYSLLLPRGCHLDVFLNDDGSTDGTGEMVATEFPEVHIVSGSGNDYWCGGMRRAWKAALETGEKYDYFLWANDDVELYSEAIDELLTVAENPECCPVGLVCGSFCDPDTGEITYGGYRERRLLLPNGKPQECRYIHGNTVLVPCTTYEKIGMFDDRWTHGFGDSDYGLCCIEAGLKCWTTSKYIGTCKQHKIKGPWLSSEVPFLKRWELMWKPVGGNIREFVLFRRKHYPFRWPIDTVKFFVQVLFPKPFEFARRLRCLKCNL